MNPIAMHLLAKRRSAPGNQEGKEPMLYDIIRAMKADLMPDTFSPMIVIFGEGTDFEAVVQLTCDPESGAWDGRLVFRDVRFSPALPLPPQHQLEYATPYAPSGVLAEVRAETFWAGLIHVFVNLMRGSDGKPTA